MKNPSATVSLVFPLCHQEIAANFAAKLQMNNSHINFQKTKDLFVSFSAHFSSLFWPEWFSGKLFTSFCKIECFFSNHFWDCWDHGTARSQNGWQRADWWQVPPPLRGGGWSLRPGPGCSVQLTYTAYLTLNTPNPKHMPKYTKAKVLPTQDEHTQLSTFTWLCWTL